MNAATQTLADFLLARIVEDEDAARNSKADVEAAVAAGRSHWAPPSWVLGTADRVLAECEAKRAMLARAAELSSQVRAYRSPRWQEVETPESKVDRLKAEARNRVAEDMLRSMALVYSDHSDYRDELQLVVD